jgi:hypothetical protein
MAKKVDSLPFHGATVIIPVYVVRTQGIHSLACNKGSANKGNEKCKK